MTVNYTTNLALGQPVTGTESGTWGDDVNNAVTSYLDIAIAGGLAVTVTTADVTLTITQGTSVATNIGSTTAQYAILNVSGAMTAARNLIVPSSSRQYVINNACTGGFLLTVKGSATTGVTLVNGEKAHVFWNGTDYSKLSNTPGGAGTFSSITNTSLTSGRVVYSGTAGLEVDSANLTFNGTTLTANTLNLTNALGTAYGGTGLTSFTSGGVVYASSSSALATGSALTFDGSNLGLGVTPSAWDFGGNLVLPGAGTYVASKNINLTFAANLFYGGGAEKYVASNPATKYFQGSGTHAWYNAPSGTAGNPITFTQAMTLDASGNLGVGTTSPGARLDVIGGAGRIIPSGGSSNSPESGAGTLNVYGATSSITTRTGALRLESYSNMAVDAGTGIAFSARYISAPNDGSYTFAKIGGYKETTTSTSGHGYLAFATTDAPGNLIERARIDSSGKFTLSTDSAGMEINSGTYQVKSKGSGQAYMGFVTVTTALQCSFNSTSAGVSLGSGATSWGTFSDESMKDIIEPITDATNKILTLRAVIGKYKTDAEGTRRSFLIAQDVQAVLPEAVDSEISENLVLRYTEVIPLLVAAIKEQQALITQLTARITALETA